MYAFLVKYGNCFLFFSIMGHGNETGIIPRFCEELFSRADVARDLNKVTVSIQMIWIKLTLGAYSFLTVCESVFYSCLKHISYIIGDKKPIFDVLKHLGVPECLVFFQVTVTLTSGLNSSKIVSRAYIQYYLR